MSMKEWYERSTYKRNGREEVVAFLFVIAGLLLAAFANTGSDWIIGTLVSTFS